MGPRSFTTHTSEAIAAPLFRISVEPEDLNGLRDPCRLRVDKITTIPKERLCGQFGRLARVITTVGLLLGASLVLNGCDSSDPTVPDRVDAFRILVFSKTIGYRHTSIESGQSLFRELGETEGFGVDVTENPGEFSSDNLSDYAVVVFLSTSEDVLNETQQAAFQAYIRAGGGFVGVHSATDTEYGWPWYGELVGAYFFGHPLIQDAAIVVEDATHPSTRHLPAEWLRRDEWYNFDRNPRAVQVLLTLREETYEGGLMGEDHPIAWYHEYDGGRAWYTAGGHTEESYEEPLFAEHLLGGVMWAAGEEG